MKSTIAASKSSFYIKPTKLSHELFEETIDGRAINQTQTICIVGPSFLFFLESDAPIIQILATVCLVNCTGYGDIVNPIFRFFALIPLVPFFAFVSFDEPQCVAAMLQILAASPRNYIHIFRSYSHIHVAAAEFINFVPNFQSLP